MATNTVRRGPGLIVVPLAGLFLVLALGSASASDEPTDGGGPGPLAQSSEQTTYGWIHVPTLSPARVFSPMSLHGITHHFVPVTPDAPFGLQAQVPGATFCSLSLCMQMGDFDVTFFESLENGQTRVVARGAEIGDEEGRVPSDADFALVYLRTAGTAPESKGHGFVYREGLPGSDTLPPLE